MTEWHFVFFFLTQFPIQKIGHALPTLSVIYTCRNDGNLKCSISPEMKHLVLLSGGVHITSALFIFWSQLKLVAKWKIIMCVEATNHNSMEMIKKTTRRLKNYFFRWWRKPFIHCWLEWMMPFKRFLDSWQSSWLNGHSIFVILN